MSELYKTFEPRSVLPDEPKPVTRSRPDVGEYSSDSDPEDSTGLDLEDGARSGLQRPQQHPGRSDAERVVTITKMLKLRKRSVDIRERTAELPESMNRRRLYDVRSGVLGPFMSQPVYALTKTLSSTTTPDLIRIGWEKFKQGRRRRDDDRYAIDVLDGEPVIDFDMDDSASIWWSRWANRQKKDSGAPATTDAEGQSVSKGPALILGQAPLPERIRIHSKQIVDVLDQIHGSGLSSYDTSVVMIRPFRALAYYEKPLRRKLEELSTKFRDVAALDKNDDADDESLTDAEKELDHDRTNNMVEAGFGDAATTAELDRANNDDPASSYEFLRCLIGFLDAEIGAKVEYLRSGPCQKVAFSDIWHMFKPGDEVVGQGGRQAYRILSVTSTCHKFVPPWQTWESRKKGQEESRGPSVALHCVHVDFDGKRLGPVSTKVEIGSFDGEKLVTSLPIYPLRFAEGPGAERRGHNDTGATFRSKLISRGRVFVDAISVRPMYYKGLTLDTEDEIDSQVVIDRL